MLLSDNFLEQDKMQTNFLTGQPVTPTATTRFAATIGDAVLVGTQLQPSMSVHTRGNSSAVIVATTAFEVQMRAIVQYLHTYYRQTGWSYNGVELILNSTRAVENFGDIVNQTITTFPVDLRNVPANRMINTWIAGVTNVSAPVEVVGEAISIPFLQLWRNKAIVVVDNNGSSVRLAVDGNGNVAYNKFTQPVG